MENKIIENFSAEQRSKTDRRQQSIPVSAERRSGADRRNSFENLIQQNNCNKADVYASFRKQQPICTTPLSIIQPIDKVEDIQDCIKDKNYLKAFGIGLLLLNSLDKEVLAFKKFKNGIIEIIKNRKITFEDYQIPHSFTENTEIIKSQDFEFLGKIDKTLFDFKIGKFILEKFGMIDIDKIPINEPDKINHQTIKIKIIGNKFSEIMGRAFLRTPVLGIATLGTLETPNIFKEKVHRKEQIIKSTVSVISVTAGTAILGAICAYYPPFGFIGAGLGAYFGYKLSNYINKKI